MVLDIVKQAVQIKMTCKSESPLISVAEYCYGCGYALREIGRTEDEAPHGYLRCPKNMDNNNEIKQIGKYQKVEDIREHYVPQFERLLDNYKNNPQMHRLLHLLIMSRVTGEVTDEIRELLL